MDHTYDPYGRITKVGSGDKDSLFGYTGHLWHPASGLNLTLFRAYDPNLGRWISRDIIGELGGINLYQYSLDDSINYLDQDGLKITPAFRNPSDAYYYELARNYLRNSSTMKNIFDKLENSTEEYKLKFNSCGDDSYDSFNRTINWDPNSALKIENNGTQTPALGLGHEMTHADRGLWGDLLAKIPWPSYGNLAERDVIKNYETPAARELGENTRTNHYGKPYYAPTSTSR